MPRTKTSKASQEACTQVLDQLKQDHQRVKEAYKAFKKMDRDADADEVEALVQQVLDELTLHAELEEDLLYPAALEALDDTDLVEEAQVEHESMHALIDQLQGLGAGDEGYRARFTVLCEYVLHHVKEEEGEMFPLLEKAELDWAAIASGMQERREDARAEDAEADTGDAADTKSSRG